jgi:hypothetical protein
VQGSAYLKTGIYRDEAIKQDSTLFVNDLKVGKTLASVSGLAGAGGSKAATDAAAVAAPTSSSTAQPAAATTTGAGGGAVAQPAVATEHPTTARAGTEQWTGGPGPTLAGLDVTAGGAAPPASAGRTISPHRG